MRTLYCKNKHKICDTDGKNLFISGFTVTTADNTRIVCDQCGDKVLPNKEKAKLFPLV